MTEPRDIHPEAVLKSVVAAIPDHVRPHVIIIGSLAAAYTLLDRQPAYTVRTKDIDSVITPRSSAVSSSTVVAEKLLAAGWKRKTEGKFGSPGSEATPDDLLPALRLYPPEGHDWFIELLTEPEPNIQAARNWMRFALSNGEHYGLPSFRFTGVATFEPIETPYGVRIARPEMMALANLLEHPIIKPDLIEGTTTKRSNKDLGRVLAIARLSDEARIETWAPLWHRALNTLFPADAKALALAAPSGIRALVASPADLQQAVDNCNNGLLASRKVTLQELDLTARRLLTSALADLESLAKTK